MKCFWRALQFWSVILFASAVLCCVVSFIQRSTIRP